MHVFVKERMSSLEVGTKDFTQRDVSTVLCRESSYPYSVSMCPLSEICAIDFTQSDRSTVLSREVMHSRVHIQGIL